MYVVTGLTKMSNDRICMSVYDTVKKSYLRPIPPNNKYTNKDLEKLKIFSVINLDKAIDKAYIIEQPHTEDFPVLNQEIESARILNSDEQLEFLHSISHECTYEIYGSHNNDRILKQKGIRNYVLPGTGTRSLGTVRVESVRIYRNSYDKVRVDFRDIAENTFFDIPYVAYESDDIEQLNYRLEQAENKFVRVSLARKLIATNWEHAACFMQVSCIHGY